MATRRYRGKTEAKALDGHAGSGLEVELAHPLKAQALIESHGGLHHVGSMQRQRLGSRLPRPPHALAHEQDPDPLAARRWRHGEEPHLRERQGHRPATRPDQLRPGPVEQNRADDPPVRFRYDLRLGWGGGG